MTPTPVLRATTEGGDRVDDPSADDLLRLFVGLESGAGNFLIVESLGDVKGQTYIQAMRFDDGAYVVEYRAGGPKAHFGTSARDYWQAHQLVAGWALNVPGWHDLATWTPVKA